MTPTRASSDSTAYVRSRLLQVLPTVGIVVLVAFLLLHLAPGDPIVALAGENGDEAYYAAMTERYGLDRPLPAQLATYVGRLAVGDLGTSIVTGRPVAEMILDRAPATLLLSLTALLLSTLVGIGLGVAQARWRGSLFDGLSSVGVLGVYAAPVFWVGQLAILGLAFGLGWFPIQGMTDARESYTGWRAVVDVGHHLALPAMVLASQQIASISRLTRAGVSAELASDHVRMARAKGLGAGRVLLVHALRRPLLPVVTVIGARTGHVVAGTVIVETVFGWPGVGRLLLSAISDRDIPVVLGMYLLIAFGVVLASLATDLAYTRLDPRVRHG